MGYHSPSIDNTYYYQLPSIVAQSIGNIWLAYDLGRRLKSLLTLAPTQCSFKVKRQHNEVAWWSNDYLIALSHDSS